MITIWLQWLQKHVVLPPLDFKPLGHARAAHPNIMVLPSWNHCGILRPSGLLLISSDLSLYLSSDLSSYLSFYLSYSPLISPLLLSQLLRGQATSALQWWTLMRMMRTGLSGTMRFEVPYLFASKMGQRCLDWSKGIEGCFLLAFFLVLILRKIIV